MKNIPSRITGLVRQNTRKLCKLTEHLACLQGGPRVARAQNKKKKKKSCAEQHHHRFRVFSYLKTPEKRTLKGIPIKKQPLPNSWQTSQQCIIGIFISFLHHECPSSLVTASGASSDQVFSKCCKIK